MIIAILQARSWTFRTRNVLQDGKWTFLLPPRSSYTKRGVESRWKQVRDGLMGKVVGK